MASEDMDSGRLGVIIAGGGVAALETALALAELAPDRTDVPLSHRTPSSSTAR